MDGMVLPHLLAAAPTSDDDTRRAIEWGIVVVIAAIGLFILARIMRKKLRSIESGPPAGFTLSDLRQLLKDGKMTPEEFERAKAKILNAHQRANEIKPA